ncbi:MAG: serine/threonine protein kinase [Verrucomicrobia bacterium]|jgi:serine/threonine protein kinase|nr:serine/threonine protein kinase [Verrucomicrobiota bacterium]MBT7065985.1 serine/threonine protein kinase [Verrucomicrobiota bacterium]MBT7699289.1 serine/threonine protein kinase [Verrucomicrobiota bacterium]
MTDENENQPADDETIISITADAVDAMSCGKCDAQIDVSELESFTEIECPQCGHPECVPAQLGQFRLLRLLGTGGMGGVYHAYDETLGRNVAIKVMLESLGEDGDFVETFKREAQAVAKLNHPNIAQIYSFGQAKGQPYIVMELINGRHMDKMIEEEPTLDEALVLRIALEIAGGLAAADEIGLIHGDIKPENILLDKKGSSKLVDFGLATFAHQNKPEGIWGTPYYIAPEKVRRHRVDARSDIYSLGATIFHALTGQPPFDGDTPVDVVKARLNAPAPAVSTLREGINPEVDRIVARMLEAEPGRRYPTYASLLGDLKKTLEKLGPSKKSTQAVRSKKVIIRKRGARPASSSKSATGPNGTPKASRIVVSRSTGSMSTTSVPAARADKSGAKDRANATPKKRSKAPLVFLIILLILGMMGGGAYFGLITLKKKAIAALQAFEAEALKAEKTQGATLCQDAAAELTTLASLEAEGMALYTTAAANVLTVEAVALPAPVPPPEPKPAAPVDTNGVAAAGSTNTNAVVEAEIAAEPEAEPVAEAVAEPEAEAVPLVEAPLIVTVGQRVVEACETVMGAHAQGRRLVEKAAALGETLQESENVVAAAVLVAEIEAVTTQLPPLTREAKEAVAKAREAAAKTTEICKRDEKARTLARAAEAEAERLRLLREEQDRREKALQAKIDAELQQVAMAEAGIRADVVAYRYSDAVRLIKRRQREFKTDAGKAAIATAIERCERLQSMKTFFIKQMKDKPFRWGYIDGPSPLDIRTATTVGIRLKDRTVRWSDISTRQMLAFIQHFIKDEALSEGIKLRELANQYLNAAIFCSINGGHAAAQKYGEAAVNLLATMQADVDRLVPPPPPEDAEE